jgi:hypothetical protein
MNLVPVLTVEAVAPMVTVEAAATVTAEVADSEEEEDKEDIRPNSIHVCLRHTKHIHNSGGQLA